MTLLSKVSVSKSTFLGVSAAFLLSTSASAQDTSTETSDLAPDTPIDLTEVTCWDVVTLNEDDRASVMTMLYGYATAKKGTSVISPEAVQVAVVLTMTECVDKPDAKVHEVLLEKMSHRDE